MAEDFESKWRTNISLSHHVAWISQLSIQQNFLSEGGGEGGGRGDSGRSMSLAHSFPYNAEVERNVFFNEINKMTATFRDNKAKVSYLHDKGNLAGFFIK